MSLEEISRTPAPKLSAKERKAIDHRIDFILDHHEPLREAWEKKVEGLPPTEQLNRLEELARKRREVMAHMPYISPKLKITKEVPEALKEFFADTFNSIISGAEEVDRGYNGRIMEYADPHRSEPNVVYKVLIRVPIGEQNDLLSEASYLADLHDISLKNKDVQIAVPEPYYCATLTNARVIAMEKAAGVSVENIIKGEIPIPETFDIDLLEERLLQFAERINAAGFYHNDMRVGNIMLNLERKDASEPLAYIIDTGNAKRDKATDRIEHKIDNTADYVMTKQVVEALRRYKSRQPAGEPT